LLSNGQALWAHASTKLCYVVRQHPVQRGAAQGRRTWPWTCPSSIGPDDRLVVVVDRTPHHQRSLGASARGSCKPLSMAARWAARSARPPWLPPPQPLRPSVKQKRLPKPRPWQPPLRF